jgi:hypothetical protein
MSLVERERDDIYGTSNVIYNVRYCNICLELVFLLGLIFRNTCKALEPFREKGVMLLLYGIGSTTAV